VDEGGNSECVGKFRYKLRTKEKIWTNKDGRSCLKHVILRKDDELCVMEHKSD